MQHLACGRAARPRGSRRALELLDLVAQALELGDARVEIAEPAREQLIEAIEHRARRAAQAVHRVQVADLGQRQPSSWRRWIEAQALDLVGSVDAAAARPAPHAGQQAQLLVVPDGARREPGLRAELADRHGSGFTLPAQRQLASTVGARPPTGAGPRRP